MLQTHQIERLAAKPQLFAAGPSIWTDPHIATQMLKAHLDESGDAASYRPERRQRICASLWQRLQLQSGSQLLDLGCGPGLYCQHFASRGLQVSGIDISSNSIAYAQQEAARASLSIHYRVADYRQPWPERNLDAVTMISEDFGVLSPDDRATVLANIFASLKPGGFLALDVCAEGHWQQLDERPSWRAEASGFWRPHPYLLLQRTFLYPEERVFCDLNAVLDDHFTVYYTWQTCFSEQGLRQELEQQGFVIVEILGDLDGKPRQENDRQMGVIACKRG